MIKQFLFDLFGYVGYAALIIILFVAIVFGFILAVHELGVAKDFFSYLWAKEKFLKWRAEQRQIDKETREQKKYRLELERAKIDRELARIKDKEELWEKYGDKPEHKSEGSRGCSPIGCDKFSRKSKKKGGTK